MFNTCFFWQDITGTYSASFWKHKEVLGGWQEYGVAAGS